MPHAALPVTLLALAAPLLVGADQRPPWRATITQFTVRERIVIRVPRVMAAPVAPPKPVVWKEGKGPKCIQAQAMAGALISARNQVDLVLIGGRRIRAKLDGDCKPLDFYSGFYVRPSPDGMICADRDAIRVRSGAACEIDQFKLLKAAK